MKARPRLGVDRNLVRLGGWFAVSIFVAAASIVALIWGLTEAERDSGGQVLALVLGVMGTYAGALASMLFVAPIQREVRRHGRDRRRP